VEGFYLHTFDQHKDEIIDSSDMITLDGSGLQAKKLDDTLITYVLSSPYAGEVSSYTFTFDAQIPVDNIGKCYLKVQLPKEISIEEGATFEASGMLVDSNGKVNTEPVFLNL
jgi:hypothetical protein